MISTVDATRGATALIGYGCENGHRWYLPKARCSHCGGTPLPTPLRGDGVAFTRTTVHRRGDGQTNAIGIALIDLDEGVRLMTRCSADVAIGSRVIVQVLPVGPGGDLLPMAEVAA